MSYSQRVIDDVRFGTNAINCSRQSIKTFESQPLALSF